MNLKLNKGDFQTLLDNKIKDTEIGIIKLVLSHVYVRMYLCVYTFVCVYCYTSLKMLHLRGKRKNTKTQRHAGFFAGITRPLTVLNRKPTTYGGDVVTSGKEANVKIILLNGDSHCVYHLFGQNDPMLVTAT